MNQDGVVDATDASAIDNDAFNFVPGYDIQDPAVPTYLFSDSSEFGGGDFGNTNYYKNILYIS